MITPEEKERLLREVDEALKAALEDPNIGAADARYIAQFTVDFLKRAFAETDARDARIAALEALIKAHNEWCRIHCCGKRACGFVECARDRIIELPEAP